MSRQGLQPLVCLGVEARDRPLGGEDAPAIVRGHVGSCPVTGLLDGDDALAARREVHRHPDLQLECILREDPVKTEGGSYPRPLARRSDVAESIPGIIPGVGCGFDTHRLSPDMNLSQIRFSRIQRQPRCRNPRKLAT